MVCQPTLRAAPRRGPVATVGLLVGLGLALAPRPVSADGLLAIRGDTNNGPTVLFPNWRRVPLQAFSVDICADAACGFCPNGPLAGLTILNYGTCSGGTGGDLESMYFRWMCGKTDSGTLTMTYAGAWTVGAFSYPAWTWAGSIPWSSDPYADCGAATLSVYADVGPCPADGCTAAAGPGYNAVLNPGSPGGMSDACGMRVPDPTSGVTAGETRMVRYVDKAADKDFAAPGDTVTFTIYHGKPGTAALAGFTVLDTLPADTHYLPGSAVPAPDVGWDPDPGPPMRLRWSLPGAAPAGGGTSAIRFSVTVDWGNDPFEPDSGALGAIEGSRVENIAGVDFLGTSCATLFAVSGPTTTVVRRYMFWNIGNQDVLFASRLGLPDDEMTYEIFIKNLSLTRTWWNVAIWDTVPPELDAWSPGYGFEDPCTGWTMSPSGCAAASPGRVVAGGGTILTWEITMPPAMTLAVRWKARVRLAATAGGTVLNRVSLMGGEFRGAGGSGSARAPRVFNHVAPLVLRTTYSSYVGMAGETGCPSGGFDLAFYPLNLAAAFELRKLQYEGGGWAATGGVSASINTFIGTCLGGFTEGTGYGGCGIERSPALYRYAYCPATPFNFLYKLTANAPVLWIYMEDGPYDGGDSFTYIPSTSLSYAGFIHYSQRRAGSKSSPGYGDSFVVFNTGMDPLGSWNPAQGTTVHVFRWNTATLSWAYLTTGEVDGHSLWMPFAGTDPSLAGHYRIVSSDTRLTVYQGFHTFGSPAIANGYNDHGGMAPNGQTGYLVSPPGGPARFYAVASHDTSTSPIMIVGNVDPATPATFRIWKYASRTPGAASSGIPASLAGSSGSWRLLGTRTAGAGLASATNPWVSGNAYESLVGDGSGAASAYQVEWVAGGRIQVYTGGPIFPVFGGGSQIHAADGLKATGVEFWMNTASLTLDCGSNSSPYLVNIFCPSAGMVVRMESGGTGGGASAVYTTTGPDQCVAFLKHTPISNGNRRNWRFWLDPGGTQGGLIAQYMQCRAPEKFFSAPFVFAGVHYTIIAPPVAYVGQDFWITVIVENTGGATKTDYCGTTSFTSTDPTAKFEGSPMDSYNYTWDSNNPAATCLGAGCTGGCDNGVKLFLNVTMTRIGTQTIVATDLLDGSITGLTAVMIVGADVKLEKHPRLVVGASGDTVTFRICWSNYSSASAFSFTITDAVPAGTAFLPEAGTWAFACGSTDNVAVVTAYSTAASVTVPPPASWVTNNPVAATRWLRWTIPMAGVQTTGCACFRVSVN